MNDLNSGLFYWDWTKGTYFTIYLPTHIFYCHSAVELLIFIAKKMEEIQEFTISLEKIFF